ncbi:MAG: phage tail protein, partial [Pseudomonadota bacterium]
DVDAVRVKVGVNALSNLDTASGDLNETRVDYRIEMQVGAGGFTPVVTSAFDGKTTSGYQRAHRIELPPTRPVNLRVVRVTPDSSDSSLQNDIYYVSLTELIDAKLRYSETAIVGLAYPASVFGGSVPTVTFKLEGMLCLVPSNYDPATRSYDESTIWDGTFVRAFTDNPAFFGYTAYVEDRWGLGDRIPTQLVDKWSVYQIGKYCDVGVDDGFGGTEPRMTINGVINQRQAAYEVITQLSSIWRGATYWGAGAVVPVQDAPADAVRLVANANVENGKFQYSSTAIDARKTVGIASYRDTEDQYKLKSGAIFEHQAGIRRFGYRDLDIRLPFCASRGEALRSIRWHIDTSLTATDTVQYVAGFDHARIRPFDIVKVADKNKVFTRTMGRVVSIAADRLSVALDAPIQLVDGESYKILLSNDIGEILEKPVTTAATSSTVNVGVSTAIPVNVVPGSVFALNATGVAPREFRVLSNERKGHKFHITALEHDGGKYARVENGLQAEITEPFTLPPRGAPAAPALAQISVSLKPDPGSISKLRFVVDFPPHPDPRVATHRVQIKEPGKPWRWAGSTTESSIDIVPEREQQGLYEVRLYAETLDGK